MSESALRDLRRPLSGVALVGVAYVVLGSLLDGELLHRVTGAVLALLVVSVGVAVLRNTRRLTGAARRSWLCLGGAALVWGAGQAVYTVVEAGERATQNVGIADTALLVAVVLLFVGTVVHPAVAVNGLSVVRSVLDGVIVATSLMLLMLTITMVQFDGGEPMALQPTLDLAYSLVDVLIFGGILLALSRVGRRGKASIVLVLLAMTCFVVGTDTYEQGWPFATAWLVGFLLLAVAARAPGAHADPASDGSDYAGHRQNVVRRVVAVLPYALVALTMTVGGTLYFYVQFPLSTVYSGIAVAMMGGMIARQSVSVLDASAAARELARGEAYFRSIVQGSSDVTTIVDADFVVVWQSPSVRAIFGQEEHHAVGRPVCNLIHRDDRAEFERVLRRVTTAAGPVTASTRARTQDASGRWRDIETSFANHLATPAIQGIVMHTRDISERSALEARLHDMAFTDALTGLPNRRQFVDRLERAHRVLAERGEAYTVLAVDLDGFKAVNDLHGHGAGDALLAEVGARLRAEVRDVDTVARLGGDEFAVLLAGAPDEGFRLGARLVEAVGAPYLLGNLTAHVSASVGVAEALLGDDGAVVLRNADLALRHAKQTGKKHVELYEPALHQGALDRVALEQDLAGALERGEIRLAYQPVFDLARGAVVGAEALMRWRHPGRGEVAPAVFIPLAEESGQIVELGRWALEEACRQIAAWDATGHRLQMGVNVSARQLRGSADRDRPLRDVVATASAAAGVAPHRLVLEITESVFLGSFDAVLAELEGVRALGAHIALDDFGTGYSSLSYLRRLPVDILKIDREFVSGMTTEDHVAALAELVVQLGGRLGIEVVAEGIETAAEAAGVLDIGCVLGQGYHLGRPVSPAEFEAFLPASVAPDAEAAVPGVTL